MTVKDLIEHLFTLDPELNVYRTTNPENTAYVEFEEIDKEEIVGEVLDLYLVKGRPWQAVSLHGKRFNYSKLDLEEIPIRGLVI